MKNKLSPADIRLKPSFTHRFEPYINGFLRRFSFRLTKIQPRNPERPSLQFVKEKLKTKEGLIGVELGVFRGENALDMFKTMNIRHLYLIDPWVSYDNKDPNMHGKQVLNEALDNTKKILRNYGDKITFIKKFSNDALKDIPDNVDFIYIDGNHDYKFVKEDMLNYYKKIKIGGIMAGHDLNHLDRHKGVTKAFFEFISKYKLRPFIESPDWWVIKGLKY